MANLSAEARVRVSVLICTYNPHQARLAKVYGAIESQTLPSNAFEVIVVDNASSIPPAKPTLQNARTVHEPQQGLTYARLRGVSESQGDIVVFVDDDNVINPDYLSATLNRFDTDPSLGALGGKIGPIWEEQVPPPWLETFHDLLALRDFGDSPIRSIATVPLSYPACAPVGAGMALRRKAIQGWILASSRGLVSADRTGGSLSSGGDNDIILHVLKSGWAVGYDPNLVLKHIIPSFRMTPDYLGKLAEGIMISWIDTLNRHDIRPWRPSPRWLKLIKLSRLFWISQPWRSPSHYINWRARRGTIIGRSMLSTRDASNNN